MEKQKVGVTKTLEYKDAVAYLEALTKSFKSGTIVIESGEDHVVMKPSGQVSIKVEAKAKKDKQKIGFEIAWNDADAVDLKISDREPAAVLAERIPAEVPATQQKAEVPAKVEPSKAPAKKSKEKKPKAKKTKAAKASPTAGNKK